MRKRHPVRRHLTGALLARTGDEMSGPALLLVAFARTGSAAEASALLAAVTVAAAAGGPVLGACLDRAERPGRLLAAALALHALGLTAVVLCLGRASFPVTLLVAVLTGLPGPALSGGWTALLPTATGPERVTALDAMTFSAASLTGPALASLTARLFGAPVAVAASAALMCAATPMTPAPVTAETGAPPPGARAPAPERGAAAVSRRGANAAVPRCGAVAVPRRRATTAPWRVRAPRFPARLARPLAAELRTGTRQVLANPRLAAVTLGSVVSCAGQGVLTACLPLLGERVLGAAAHGALLLSCSAAAALAANAVLARRTPAPDPVKVMCGGALLQAAALVLAAAGGNPAALVAAAVVTGAGEGPQLAALFAVRHREAPERFRAQIFTTGASAKITAFAAGAAAAGPLGTWSPPGALLVAAALQVVAAGVTGGRRPRR
ncbi:MFS transporter [Streptomyces sp. NPDC017202]|uniref:MFS transporter n=1 Tax=Streptomyces sp. NPDC017202 TaxID=3364981 RepID=UPI00379920AF